MIPDNIRFPEPEEFCFGQLHKVYSQQRCLLSWRRVLMSGMSEAEKLKFTIMINTLAHEQFGAPIHYNRSTCLQTINDQDSLRVDGKDYLCVSYRTARERLSKLFRTACVKVFGFVVDASGKTGHIPKAPEPTPEPTPEPERVEQRELVAV